MDILRVSHKEIQHSNFLAWIFNPKESHNLGDIAVKEFIRIILTENELENQGLIHLYEDFTFLRLIQKDFKDLIVKREYKNIDLLLTSKNNKLCIVIENKIYSYEKHGQLMKYREEIDKKYSSYTKLFVYLSLNTQEISKEVKKYYLQLNYAPIIKLIKNLISCILIKISEKTKFYLEDYLQTLRSMTNNNPKIEKVATELYNKYKSAFDLIFKYYDPTGIKPVWMKLKELIEKEKSLKPFSNSRNYLRFQPVMLYENIVHLKKAKLLGENDQLEKIGCFYMNFTFHPKK